MSIFKKKKKEKEKRNLIFLLVLMFTTISCTNYVQNREQNKRKKDMLLVKCSGETNNVLRGLAGSIGETNGTEQKRKRNNCTKSCQFATKVNNKCVQKRTRRSEIFCCVITTYLSFFFGIQNCMNTPEVEDRLQTSFFLFHEEKINLSLKRKEAL